MKITVGIHNQNVIEEIVSILSRETGDALPSSIEINLCYTEEPTVEEEHGLKAKEDFHISSIESNAEWADSLLSPTEDYQDNKGSSISSPIENESDSPLQYYGDLNNLLSFMFIKSYVPSNFELVEETKQTLTYKRWTPNQTEILEITISSSIRINHTTIRDLPYMSIVDEEAQTFTTFAKAAKYISSF